MRSLSNARVPFSTVMFWKACLTSKLAIRGDLSFPQTAARWAAHLRAPEISPQLRSAAKPKSEI
eukprot:6989302-Pyramimonas_sp.AAC.1